MDEITTMTNVREAMITDLQTQLVTANAENIEAKADLDAARAENEKLTADIAAAHALLRERLAVLDVGHDTFDKPSECRVCMWNDKVRAELAKEGKAE